MSGVVATGTTRRAFSFADSGEIAIPNKVVSVAAKTGRRLSEREEKAQVFQLKLGDFCI